MGNQGSLAKDISPQLVNILGDSYINTELADIFNEGTTRIGTGLIDNNVGFKGI